MAVFCTPRPKNKPSIIKSTACMVDPLVGVPEKATVTMPLTLFVVPVMGAVIVYDDGHCAVTATVWEIF